MSVWMDMFSSAVREIFPEHWAPEPDKTDQEKKNMAVGQAAINTEGRYPSGAVARDLFFNQTVNSPIPNYYQYGKLYNRPTGGRT